MVYLGSASNSRLKTKKLCLLKYFFHYVMYYEGEREDESALNFGSFVHRVLELGVESTKLGELTKIAEQVQKTHKLPAGRKRDLPKCLSNFCALQHRINGVTVGVELDIRPEVMPGVPYICIIDRVIKASSGNILIIDYKTGKRELTSNELMSDPQMMGYVWGYCEEFGIPISKVRAAHYYPMTDNLVVSHAYNGGHLRRWKANTVREIWDIRKRKKDQFYPQENNLCGWCEYQHICPLKAGVGGCGPGLAREKVKKAKNDAEYAERNAK